MQPVDRLDRIRTDALHVEKKRIVVAGLHTHHRHAAERLDERRMRGVNARDDRVHIRR